VEPLVHAQVIVKKASTLQWLSHPDNEVVLSRLTDLNFAEDCERFTHEVYDENVTLMVPHLARLSFWSTYGFVFNPQHFALMPLTTRTTLRLLYLNVQPQLHSQLGVLCSFDRLETLVLDYRPCPSVNVSRFDYSAFTHTWNAIFPQLEDFEFTWPPPCLVPVGCRQFLASCRFAPTCTMSLRLDLMVAEEVLALNPLFDAHPACDQLIIECQGIPAGSTVFNHNIRSFSCNFSLPEPDVFRRAKRLPSVLYLPSISDPNRVPWHTLEAILEGRKAAQMRKEALNSVKLVISTEWQRKYPNAGFRWSANWSEEPHASFKTKMAEYVRRLDSVQVVLSDMDGNIASCSIENSFKD
jgi:hypothetical protein